MSKISMIAKMSAAEGKEAELEARFRELIAAADEEPGCEVYSVHKDTKNPGVYYFFELYRDGDALAVHGKGDRMKEAMGALGGGLLAGRPEIIAMDPIAAKGLSI